MSAQPAKAGEREQVAEAVELRKLLAKAAKDVQLPLWQDSTACEGSYGSGPDAREGYNVSVVMDDKGRHVTIFDCYDIALIEEEFDEDGATAWDTASFDLANLFIGTVNALPALLSALAEARSEVERVTTDLGWANLRRQEAIDRYMVAEARAEAAEAERDTLAAQLVGAREALESVQTIAASGADKPSNVDHLRRTIMAMSSTAAVAAHQVRQALSVSILRGAKTPEANDQ